jgi:DNA-binding MarR family transcriptional regulator
MAASGIREVSLLVAQLRRMTLAMVTKRLAAVGVSLATYKVLLELINQEEVLQHELAWDAGMDPAAISRLVRTMAEEGYVTTRIDPSDKRQRFVSLTKKGRELERSLSPIVDAALEPFESVLTPAETATLIAILRKGADGVARVVQELAAQESKSLAPAPRVKRAQRIARR